jgi:hypothetical protein
LIDNRTGFFVRCDQCKPSATVIYGDQHHEIDFCENDDEVKALVSSIDWDACKQSAVCAWNRRAAREAEAGAVNADLVDKAIAWDGAQKSYEKGYQAGLRDASPSAPHEAGAVKHIRGIDGQVLVAASEMDANQKRQPEWLWFEADELPTFGRWMRGAYQAPYIRADLVLSALASPAPHVAVPEGWVMVPEQPSAEMVLAGKLADQLAAGFGEDWDTRIADVYRAMLAAAPTPPHSAENASGWQDMSSAPHDRWLLLDMSYCYEGEVFERYEMAKWVDSDDGFNWDCGDELSHQDSPIGWMDIPKTCAVPHPEQKGESDAT